ncbi:MAG: glycosyltransferase family 39 protein [Thermodesulfobacteriota bacterium]|nr:glycosyltransferase family 39 protein [Thermodesulfobacteriota bacterium]
MTRTHDRQAYSPPVTTVVVLLLCAGAGLRIAAASDCLWFDEIWSYMLSRHMTQPWQALTVVNVVDNNHPLNTFFMYMMGDPYDWRWFRVPSLITGTLLLILIWRAADRFSPSAGMPALFMATVSHPFILYSSEARGYAPALFFSVSAFFFIQQYRQERGTRPLVLFWFTITMGLLANLTVAFIWLAIFLWSVMHEMRVSSSFRTAMTHILKCHLVPLLPMAYLSHAYLVRNMAVGNIGSRSTEFITDFLATVVAALMGTPSTGGWFVAGLFLFICVFLYGWRSLYRTNAAVAIFLLLAVCLPPLLGNLGRQLMYFRFSLVAFPFTYIVLAIGIAACYKGNRLAKTLCLLFVLFFSYGNITRTHALITIGRGDYLGAMSYMAAQPHTGPRATAPGNGDRTLLVGSDNDFRNLPILYFYARYLPQDTKMIYVGEGQWPTEGTDWLIRHSRQPCPETAALYRPNGRHVYRLKKIFPYAGVSGWNWYLYRRVSTDTTSADRRKNITGSETSAP